jgi:hypothetical protein
VDKLYLRLLTRLPNTDEKQLYLQHLRDGYDTRLTDIPTTSSIAPSNRAREKYVSWSNHLDAEATTVRLEQEKAARQGDPPTQKLSPSWRTRLEDVLWALLNSPEWAYSP